MIVTVRAGQTICRPEVDLSDLTKSTPTGPRTWDGAVFTIPMTPEPSAAEQTMIRRRLMTRDPAHEAWVAAVGREVTALEATLLPGPATRLLRLLAADLTRGIDQP